MQSMRNRLGRGEKKRQKKNKNKKNPQKRQPVYLADQNLNLPRLELDHEWMLLPKYEDPLVGPVVALWTELNVKVPKELGKNQAHLVVGQVLAHAVARAVGERL